jgi:hypothetical protein
MCLLLTSIIYMNNGCFHTILHGDNGSPLPYSTVKLWTSNQSSNWNAKCISTINSNCNTKLDDSFCTVNLVACLQVYFHVYVYLMVLQLCLIKLLLTIKYRAFVVICICCFHPAVNMPGPKFIFYKSNCSTLLLHHIFC